MGRPEILWPLFGELDALPGLGPKRRAALGRIGLTRPVDLIFHAPERLVDRTPIPTLLRAREDDIVTVEAVIQRHFPSTDSRAPYRILARDAETEFTLVFFHARDLKLDQRAPAGATRIISGRLQLFDGSPQIAHPDWLLPPGEAAAMPRFEPVYASTERIPQRVIATAVQAGLTRAPQLPEWADPAFLTEHGFPPWRAALETLHAPPTPEAAFPARARLAFDELLSHQLALALARQDRRRGKGHRSTGDGALRAKAADAAGFAPTGAQNRALAEIEADMAGEARMTRLLQGDVGSGKTWVALMAMLVAAEAGGQAALMAPTSILARQHREALAPLAQAAGVSLDLLTGRDKGAQRAGKLARIASGETQLLVGTHSLFQADVDFADLRLAIIDEQHRFGVRQRMALSAKGRAADQLIMTATPIPRSLALAGYGDLDISILDEKPPGRRPIETRLLPLSRVDDVIARLGAALGDGRRAYWVCPLIAESQAAPLAAAESRFAALKQRFGDAVRLVHGDTPQPERDAAMADFATGRARLLVATTVIEVGVNVPEATIMVIEQAESFGLAQLHQLRGRVGRGAEASFCLMLHGALTAAARTRLAALRDSEDGFALAEADLKLRGPGDLLGAQQSGLPQFRIADLERDTALMRRARDEARLIVATDPALETPRGQALRTLLWLHERDQALKLLRAG